MKNYHLQKKVSRHPLLIPLATAITILVFIVFSAICFVKVQRNERDLYVFNTYSGIVTEITPAPENHLADPDAAYHFAMSPTTSAVAMDTTGLMYFSYHPEWTLGANIDDFAVGDIITVFVLYHPSGFTGTDFVYPVINVHNAGKPF